MEIKRQLKNLDVKISRLAQELGISRPTLDTYIEYYENGQQIPNERYQEIFEYLFADELDSTIEFAKRFDYVKRAFLQTYNSDKRQSKEQSIRDNISMFASDEDAGEELLEFINLLINNSKVDLVRAITSYFNFVNGLKQFGSADQDDKDIALFSHLYKIFAEYQSGTIQVDEKSYEGFIDKSNRIFKKKNTDSASDELLDYLQKNIPEGSNIDLNYIKQLLDKKEN